jgi:hypothetical protein
MTDITDTSLTRLNVSDKATHSSLTDIDTPLRGVSVSVKEARMLGYSRMRNLPTATKTNHQESDL